MMVATIGQKLQAARTKRKLTLDDASRATKIRTRQLADLERDEYSNFPNLAYAKGFLISYGKYLEVDVRPYLDSFEDANSFGLDNYQYLSEVPLGVYRATRRPTRRRSGRKPYAILAWAIGLVALTFFCWQLYVSYQRLGDLDKLASHQEALERGEPGASTAGAPSAAPQPAAAATPADDDSSPRSADTEAVQSAPPPPPDVFHGAGNGPAARDGRRLPSLPLPGDGGAVRQLIPDATEPQAPFLICDDAALPARSAAGKRGSSRASWSPETLDGYRFYVRSLDRYSVEIFRTGIPRAETVLNNPRM
jgi:transcriptional regulator with XRE-family HTH domain